MMILLLSCSEDTIEEPFRTYKGIAYEYNIQGSESNEWIPLANKEVVFSHRELFSEASPQRYTFMTDETGYYEFSLPYSAIGYSVNQNGTTIITGRNEISFATAYPLVYSISENSNNEVREVNYYHGRKAYLIIDTFTNTELDSAFVEIEHADPRVHAAIYPQYLKFYQSTFNKVGYVFWEGVFDLYLPYDPDPAYQVKLTTYTDGGVTQETITEVRLNYELEEYFYIE